LKFFMVWAVKIFVWVRLELKA